VSWDSTAIVGREKAANKERISNLPRKKGRPDKGQQRQPPEPKRLDTEKQMSLKVAA